MSLFDIVIPLGPNDCTIINKQIEYTKKNVLNYRNIYIISYDPSLIIDGCITIDESIFPFNLKTIEEYHGKSKRTGWYLQQLLKLYAGFVIPDILDKWLVIDSDTFFLKPTSFIENNMCLYNYGSEYHKAYFVHMLKLDESLVKIEKNKSGISHHMMFEKKYVEELIELIEKKHDDTFYKLFLKFVEDYFKIKGSGASEYEIYFNYMLKFHKDKIKIRPLKWCNTRVLNLDSNDYDYISYHHHMRRNK